MKNMKKITRLILITLVIGLTGAGVFAASNHKRSLPKGSEINCRDHQENRHHQDVHGNKHHNHNHSPKHGHGNCHGRNCR